MPSNDDECAICLSPPDLPRTLPCGHTFCGGCCLRVLARAQSVGAETAACPGCRAPFSATALDVPALRSDCRTLRQRRRWWASPTERERELRVALDELARPHTVVSAEWPAAPPPGWPRWLRLWHFVAGILLSLAIAAVALAYDPPRWLAAALTDGAA